MNLSSISVKAVATSLLLVSTTGLAFANHHKSAHHNVVANYKGEPNYKAEPIPCPPPKMLLGGFYVGAGVGYDSYRTRINTGVFASDMDSVFGLATSHTNSATGWLGNLFIGYGQYFNDLYYLGAEVFGTYSGAQGSQSTTVQAVDFGVGDFSDNILKIRSRVNANWGWGISVLPGMKLADTLLAYVRLGYSWVNLEGKANGNIDGFPIFSRSNNNTGGGFNYGVGMESLVYENWSLRGDFNHTDYTSFNSGRRNSGVFFASSSSVAAGRGSFDPSDNQFVLSVIYHIV